MTAALRVVVVGDVMTDVIVRPEGDLVPGSDRRATIRTRPGGSAANQAAWLGALGARPTLLARVGAADRDRHAAELAAHGVEPLLTADPDTASGMIVTILAPDGERSFLTDRGANARLARADLPDALLDRADWLHVSGYALFDPGPRAAVLDYMAAAACAGVPISLDAASAGFLREVGAVSFLDWTAGTQMCFANAEEATILAGTTDPAAQLGRLTQHYPIAVIKRGADGAEAATAIEHHAAPAPRIEARDTTGAGDAFLAGFLCAWHRAAPLPACLQAGVEEGARAVTAFGGRPPAMPPFLSPARRA